LLSQEQAAEMLDQLTSKQVEVLELLTLHRTTKQIAQELNLAPNTVDQRIAFVREKWGTVDRRDTARQYTELQAICGKTTYGSKPVDATSSLDEEGNPSSTSETETVADPPPSSHAMLPERPFGLQLVDDRYGQVGRWALVFIVAAAIAVTAAATLAIADALGRML
jgi:DNA-binding CsgD family transcriptional regulator